VHSDFGTEDAKFCLADGNDAILFLCWAKEMGESLLVPLYERIHVIMDAHSLIGHMIGSAILHCVTVSDFLSFFCCSKVMETKSAKFRSADEWSRMLPPIMKAIFQRQSCFVCCCSALVTLQYLHDRMAQKWAAAASYPIACRNSVDLEERMRRRTQTGKAFCCFSLGSSFLYDLICPCRSQLTLCSASLWGSSRSFSLKAAATALMAFETVHIARGPSPCRKNCP
jgi:hypothetical protein